MNERELCARLESPPRPRVLILGDLIPDTRLVTLFGRDQRLARAFHAIFARGAESRPEAVKFVAWVRREIGEAS